LGPRRYLDPLRNRIIAALSASMFVLETAERSGSCTTVRFAVDLELLVAATPVRIFQPQLRRAAPTATEERESPCGSLPCAPLPLQTNALSSRRAARVPRLQHALHIAVAVLFLVLRIELAATRRIEQRGERLIEDLCW